MTTRGPSSITTYSVRNFNASDNRLIWLCVSVGRGWCIVRVGSRTISTVSVFTVVVLCASCRTDSSPDLNQAQPIVGQAEFNAREDCLHQEVARLLEPQGSPPSSLQTIAATATNFCSHTIAARLKGVSPAAAKEDQIKTEQHAFAIGLEIREGRASR
jgi:hypothetical protein